MPKAVREVKSFNLGVVTSADDNDIKADAAVYSKDIDPNSSEGRLKGRYKDLLIDVPVYRKDMVITTPDASTQITREVNINSDTITDMNLHSNVASYPLQINLVGTAPTASAIVRVKILNFTADDGDGGTFLKISHDGTNYNNSGEYEDLTFTTGNYETYQTIYLKPQGLVLADEVFNVDVSVTSTDPKWNSSQVDYVLSYTLKATIEGAPAIVIKRSTYKLHGVLEGEQQGYKVELKLAAHPEFYYDTENVILTFTSNDQGRLYVHWTGSGVKESTKSFSFNNLNYGTYQTLYPFVLDDGIKQGNLQFSMNLTGNSNFSAIYEDVLGSSELEGAVRFDDGTLLDNDFHSPTNPFNVSSEESSIGGGGDGTGDEDDKWIKP